MVAQSALAPYVQDALDEIQYAIGPTTSTYGAMRAADGHPAPFKLALSTGLTPAVPGRVTGPGARGQ